MRVFSNQKSIKRKLFRDLILDVKTEDENNQVQILSLLTEFFESQIAIQTLRKKLQPLVYSLQALDSFREKIDQRMMKTKHSFSSIEEVDRASSSIPTFYQNSKKGISVHNESTTDDQQETDPEKYFKPMPTFYKNSKSNHNESSDEEDHETQHQPIPEFNKSFKSQSSGLQSRSIGKKTNQEKASSSIPNKRSKLKFVEDHSIETDQEESSQQFSKDPRNKVDDQSSSMNSHSSKLKFRNIDISSDSLINEEHPFQHFYKQDESENDQQADSQNEQEKPYQRFYKNSGSNPIDNQSKSSRPQKKPQSDKSSAHSRVNPYFISLSELDTNRGSYSRSEKSISESTSQRKYLAPSFGRISSFTKSSLDSSYVTDETQKDQSSDDYSIPSLKKKSRKNQFNASEDDSSPVPRSSHQSKHHYHKHTPKVTSSIPKSKPIVFPSQSQPQNLVHPRFTPGVNPKARPKKDLENSFSFKNKVYFDFDAHPDFLDTLYIASHKYLVLVSSDDESEI